MIREIARRTAKWLPDSARARIAARRFGYTVPGVDLAATHQPLPDGNVEFTLAGNVRLVVTPDAVPDLLFHFVENGDSRNEMASFLRISRNAPPDAWLVDVGAHKGLFSLVHLLTAPSHRAVLIEPSPPLATASRRLLALNGVTAAAQVQVAGAAADAGTWHVVTDSLGFARSAAPDDACAVTVPLVTIDRVCESAPCAPSILKIDVEGAEGGVLRGARETVRRSRPVICLELHLDLLERRGERLGDLLDPLTTLGYRLQSTTGHRLAPWRVKRSLSAILRVVALPA